MRGAGWTPGPILSELFFTMNSDRFLIHHLLRCVKGKVLFTNNLVARVRNNWFYLNLKKIMENLPD